MIILYLGGIGSGKSLSAVRQIQLNKQFCYTNFKLKNTKNYKRLEHTDILNFEVDEKKGTQKPSSVNWNFWDKARKEHKSFSIYIDEIHNLIHARQSMSRRNILMSKWVSQIRKITSDSMTNNLYLISQTIRKVDVDFRELAHLIITCDKVGIEGEYYIINKYYEGLEDYEMRIKAGTSYFKAKDYYRYYNTNEMVEFGDSEVFV